MSLRHWVYAALYDPLDTLAEPQLAPLRARSAGRAQGNVLEIGAGTGANLPFYPSDIRLSVVEPNPHMAVRLQRKAAGLGRAVEVTIAAGERLPYPADSFDAIVATLVLCSVSDQARTLAEARRVLRPGGHFLFLEHVVSPDDRVRRWQRRLNPVWRFIGDGCTLDRDTGTVIGAAGFSQVDLEELDLRPALPLIRRLIVGQAVA